MAIHAYVGKPGHGKSYGVVEFVVVPSLKQGRHIVTNIPLSVDDLISEFSGEVTQLPADWHEQQDLEALFPEGCVAIIDECWKRWPAGQAANHANAIDKKLLAEHRHRVDAKGNSMRVVIVTQDLAQISSWVRLLVETTYRVRKFTKKRFKTDIYTGAVTGDAPSKKKFVRTSPGVFRKEIFNYYSSATQSQNGLVGDESSSDGRGSIFRSFGIWGIIVMIAIGMGLGYWGLNKFFHPKSKTNDPVSQLNNLNNQPAEPPISKTWRLVGFIHPSRPDPNSRSIAEPLALISDNNGNSRYISFRHCRYFEDYTEAYCIVDGSKITNWSLKKPLPIVGGLIGGGV